MDQAGVVGAQLGQAVGGRGVEGPVGLAVQDGGDGGGVLQPVVVADAVGVAVGLGVGAPLAEVGIANQEHAGAGVVGLDQVGAGAGQRGGADVLRRHIGGQDAGVRQGQAGQELGVRAVKAYRHGRGGVVGLHAVQHAVGGSAEAGRGAGDGAVVGLGRWAGDAENAAEGGRDVRCAHGGAGAEADAGAEVEGVGQAIPGRWEGVGEVGDKLVAAVAGDFAEGDQAVIGEGEDLPVLGGVVDLRVDGAGRAAGQQVQFAAAAGGLGLGWDGGEQGG